MSKWVRQIIPRLNSDLSILRTQKYISDELQKQKIQELTDYVDLPRLFHAPFVHPSFTPKDQPLATLIHYVVSDHSIDSFWKLVDQVQGKKILFYYFSPPSESFALCSKQTEKQITRNEENFRSLTKNRHFVQSFDFVFAEGQSTQKYLLNLGFAAERMQNFIAPTLRALSLNPSIREASSEEHPAILQQHQKYKKDRKKLDQERTFLTIAPLLPSQRIEDTIRIFAGYQTRIHPNSKLIVLTQPGLKDYLLLVRDIVATLGVQEQVIFLEADDEKNNTFAYESADLLISSAEWDSPREDFLEAARWGIPIVSYKNAGSTEILGDEGIYFTERNVPAVAELLHVLVSDLSLRKKVVQTQQRKVETLDRQSLRLDKILTFDS